MKNKNYKLAKIFSLIPFIVFSSSILMTIVSIILADVFPNIAFLSIISITIISLILIFIPICAFSVLGIVFSSKSMKSNNTGKAWLVISILDIVFIIIFILIVALAFYAGANF